LKLIPLYMGLRRLLMPEQNNNAIVTLRRACPCLTVPILRIFCVLEKENFCRNITGYIISLVLCVDIRLILRLHL